jgi:hypothetical protein
MNGDVAEFSVGDKTRLEYNEGSSWLVTAPPAVSVADTNGEWYGEKANGDEGELCVANLSPYDGVEPRDDAVSVSLELVLKPWCELYDDACCVE